ncbi:MAG: hypothetical protein IPK96_15445 [Flammeovirgaceae bacterium]|jgi:hypothetical protein|nr:hypothetical protein [Flammeovirgaceae bacterium]
MKLLVTLILLAQTLVLGAQPAAKAIEDKSLNLKDRYQVMKTGSQTYEDYKVIKEHILEGFWKITMDSVNKQQASINVLNSRISTLEGELLASQNNIKEQQASVEGIVYDSKHISVIGIPFGKGAFLILTAIIVGGLVVMLVIIMGRMKIAHGAMKEKELIAHTLTQEFDEYKKKALEKQSKLSRELQNERNRLVDMRGQKM